MKYTKNKTITLNPSDKDFSTKIRQNEIEGSTRHLMKILKDAKSDSRTNYRKVLQGIAPILRNSGGIFDDLKSADNEEDVIIKPQKGEKITVKQYIKRSNNLVRYAEGMIDSEPELAQELLLNQMEEHLKLLKSI